MCVPASCQPQLLPPAASGLGNWGGQRGTSQEGDPSHSWFPQDVGRGGPEGGGLRSAARKCRWLMSNSREMYGSSCFWDVDLVSHCLVSEQSPISGGPQSLGVTDLWGSPIPSCAWAPSPRDLRPRRGDEMAPGVEEEVEVAAPTVIWKGERAGGAGCSPGGCSPTLGAVSCPAIAPEAPRGRGVSPGGSSRCRSGLPPRLPWTCLASLCRAALACSLPPSSLHRGVPVGPDPGHAGFSQGNLRAARPRPGHGHGSWVLAGKGCFAEGAEEENMEMRVGRKQGTAGLEELRWPVPAGDGPVPGAELLRDVVPWAGRELGAVEEENSILDS